MNKLSDFITSCILAIPFVVVIILLILLVKHML
jgi:hypothetical protein